jgi:hypothetical protein
MLGTLLIDFDFRKLLRISAGILISTLLLFFALRFLTARPQVLFWDDSWGYFLPAARHAAGEPFASVLGRTIAYPALLNMVLSFGDLRWLFTVQSILAVLAVTAAIGSMLLVVRQSRYRTFGLVLALLFTLLLVSYQPITNYVSFGMPEILYISHSMIVVFLALAVPASNSARVRLLLFVSGTILTIATALVKPHWWGAAIVSIGIFAYGWGTVVRHERLLGLGALILVLAGAGSLIFAQLNFSKEDTSVYTFGPLTLFCTHLDILRPTLDGPIPPTIPLGSRKALLGEIDAVLASKDPDWSLNGGLNSDKCMYSKKIRNLLWQAFEKDQDVGHFATSAFIHGVEQDPKGYLAKVFHQFLSALRMQFASPLSLASSNKDYAAQVSALPASVRYAVQDAITVGETSPVFQGRLATIGNYAGRVMSAADRITIAIFSLAFIAACTLWFSSEPLDRNISPMFLVAFSLYLASLSVVAVSHTFDVNRYLECAAPMALLALFCAALVLLAEANRFIRWMSVAVFGDRSADRQLAITASSRPEIR